MEYEILINKNCPEKVIVYAHKNSEFTENIKKLCESEAFGLIGYHSGKIQHLSLIDINCFVVENNKIFALTKSEKYQLKQRLYQLEESLPDSFVKINQSCLANIQMIEIFEATFAGSLTVRFKNGYTDYVSRRNLKKVKERFGL